MRISGGTRNAQLSRVIVETGHTEFIVVADAGLPIPKAVERIDLALRPGVPSFLDVLDTVLDEFVVERAVVAREMVEQSPDMLAALRQRLDSVGVDVEFVGHSELKQETYKACAIVRSGEFTPFANVLLYAGVPF